MSVAPYGWATVCPPGRARAATRRHVLRVGNDTLSIDHRPPRMGWEHMNMGKPGSRGHARMMKSMQRLRDKGCYLDMKETLETVFGPIEVNANDMGGQTDFTIPKGDPYLPGTVQVRRWHSTHQSKETANRIFVSVKGAKNSDDRTVCLTHDQARALMLALNKALAIPLSPGSGE